MSISIYLCIFIYIYQAAANHDRLLGLTVIYIHTYK